jgi:hypothetical protein
VSGIGCQVPDGACRSLTPICSKLRGSCRFQALTPDT